MQNLNSDIKVLSEEIEKDRAALLKLSAKVDEDAKALEDAEHQDNADFDKLRSNLENADKEFNSLNQEIGVKKLKLSSA